MRAAFGEMFQVPAGYLDTAAIGIPPAGAVSAVRAAVDDWSSGAASAPAFDEPVATARAAWAWLVGVEPAHVAIGGSVSQLAGLVAASVPDGTRVLTAESEFTSLTFPFAAQQDRGVSVDEVPLDEVPQVADAYDVVAVSAVQSADGAVVDLEALRHVGARVLLDVTQAAGWLPLSLDWASWVVGGCYKWLLSPRGAAWLAVHPSVLDELRPHHANWYGGQDRWSSIYGLPLRLATEARGFDLSPAWLAHVGAAVAMPWLAQLDLEKVREHCAGLADTVRTELGLSPRGSAITAVDDPEAASKLAAHGISAGSRAGKVRLAFALYNTDDEVRSVVRALKS